MRTPPDDDDNNDDDNDDDDDNNGDNDDNDDDDDNDDNDGDNDDDDDDGAQKGVFCIKVIVRGWLWCREGCDCGNVKSVWSVKQHSPPAFFYRSVVDEEPGIPLASECVWPSVGALGGLVKQLLTRLEVQLKVEIEEWG